MNKQFKTLFVLFHNNCREYAFTLAETLITLVVVGVVAALTIPSMIASYQKQESITRLKKVYSEICQAVQKAKVENGDVKYWDFNSTEDIFFNKYLYKHFIGIKKNTLQENKRNISYKQISGQPENSLRIMWDASTPDVVVYTLASGTQLFLPNIPSVRPSDTLKEIYIDTNGYKKPNQYGKDLFLIFFLKSGEVIFHQSDDAEDALTTRRSREKLLNGPSQYRYQCNKSGRGMWCGALIQKDGWQMKDDYPW